jgi:uncharacterized damage-inducible protein DinB
MTIREFHLQCRRNEFPAFKRVLAALPHEKLQYTPHERSQTASQIIHTLIAESAACLQLIDTGELNFTPGSPIPDAELAAAFETQYDRLIDRITRMTEGDWDRPGQFLVQGHVVMQQPVGAFLWLFFFDAIHHRGQLSTYIRPMGGKVPSIYGPSGDDPGMKNG